MIQITKDDVIRSVRELISERGAQYVNPRYKATLNEELGIDAVTDEPTPNGNDYDGICRYVAPDGTASCIVGSVLAKAGVTTEALSLCEGTSARQTLDKLHHEDVTRVDNDADHLLVDLQSHQDSGKPWGAVAELAGITV